jgi:two-component system, NarL family, invasion response regulator UvrY
MNILLVDDHAIVRDGLRRLLEAATGNTVFEAVDGQEALAQVAVRRIDLVILDLNLPGIGGLELLRRIMESSRARVLILSMHAEPLYAARALDAGAAGYVSKNASPDELLAAVQRVGAGGRYVENEIAQALAFQVGSPSAAMGQLSAREVEIMRLLAAGRGLAEIAEALGVAYKTVANTCTHIKEKLGAAHTADLIRISVDRGLV